MKRHTHLLLLVLLCILVSCDGENSGDEEAGSKEAGKSSCSVEARATVQTNDEYDTTDVISEFSWYDFARNPKDQVVMGPCHAISAVGVIETSERLYYNYNESLNLAERYAVSNCNPGSNPYSAATADVVMTFTRDNGLVTESYFALYDISSHTFYGAVEENYIDYVAENVEAKIADYRIVSFTHHDDVKRAILEYGPVVASIKSDSFKEGTGHGVQVVGWKLDTTGETRWEVLDSWPNYSRHYYINLDFVAIQESEYVELFQVVPVTDDATNWVDGWSRNYHDDDGDGYYFWGIGPKPEGCPGYDEPDGDDTDPDKGPRDENGFCMNLDPCAPLPATTTASKVENITKVLSLDYVSYYFTMLDNGELSTLYSDSCYSGTLWNTDYQVTGAPSNDGTYITFPLRIYYEGTVSKK